MMAKAFFNPPNMVTYLRIVLVFVAVSLMLYSSLFNARIAAALIIVLVIAMDFVDGFVARAFGYSTRFGSMLDIVGDRIVENVLWIVFAYISLIPVWVPLIVITRSFVTDSLRAYALSRGRTAFGRSTMMQSYLGRLLVSSQISRFIYAVLKSVAFAMLALLFATSHVLIKQATMIVVWVVVAFCVVRGFFVVYDGLSLLDDEKSKG